MPTIPDSTATTPTTTPDATAPTPTTVAPAGRQPTTTARDRHGRKPIGQGGEAARQAAPTTTVAPTTSTTTTTIDPAPKNKYGIQVFKNKNGTVNSDLQTLYQLQQAKAQSSLDTTKPEADKANATVILNGQEQDQNGQTVTPRYQLGPTLLTGRAVEDASAGVDQSGKWIVNPKFKGGKDGIDLFNAAAAKCNAGDPVCPALSGSAVRRTGDRVGRRRHLGPVDRAAELLPRPDPDLGQLRRPTRPTTWPRRSATARCPSRCSPSRSRRCPPPSARVRSRRR